MRESRVLLPYIGAHAIEDKVDTLAVGKLLDAFAEVGGLAVVDDLVGSPFHGRVELPLAAGGGDNASAHHLGDLDAHASDAASCGLNQHIVPRLDLGLGDEAVPRGVGGDGQRGGLGELHVVGDHVGVDGRGGDVVGVAAVEVDAEALLVRAPLVVAHGAVLAAVAGNTVIEYYAVADPEGGDGSGADGNHLTGDVAAHDAGQGAVVGAADAKVQIKVVESAGPHLEHDFARADLGVRAVAVDQFVGAAVFVNVDRLHQCTSATAVRLGQMIGDMGP